MDSYEPLSHDFFQNVSSLFLDEPEAEASFINHLKRLDSRAAKVWSWAMRQDHAFLAQRFADEWIQKKISSELIKVVTYLKDLDGEMLRRKHEARQRGAAAKLARDPVQAAKLEAFKLWKDWQTGKTLHRSGAAFDRYVVDSLPTIKATKTVERWRSKWAKGV